MTAVQFAMMTDVQARSSVDLTGRDAQVNALLQDAAVVIRRYTKQTFVLEQTTEKIRSIGGKLRLPHTPIVSVDSVFVLDYLGNQIPVVLPYWDGGDEIWLLYGQTVVNLAEGLRELFRYNTPLCQITYTHGYQPDDMPPELLTVSCSMALRALSVPSQGVIQSETAGPFSASLTPTAAAGPLYLSAAEKCLLDAFRIKSRTMELR